MSRDDLFNRFRALPMLKDVIGLECSGNDATYFCTPVGAVVIGWLGVDGIHFCFIPSIHSDMIFAVSPMPCGQHYVEPIARSFKDFLSLVYSCKGAGPLEQVCWMDEQQFSELLASEQETHWPEREAALNTLRQEFGIEPQTNVYQSVKCLQDAFDYSVIPFSQEYYEILGIERNLD